MRARGGADGLESGVWYGRCKLAVEEGPCSEQLMAAVTMEEVRVGERAGVWQQPAVPMGEIPEWQPRAPVDVLLCAQRGVGDKTERNKIKQSQSDGEEGLSKLTASLAPRGQSVAWYAGRPAVQLNGPLKGLSWPQYDKNPCPHLNPHPPPHPEA